MNYVKYLQIVNMNKLDLDYLSLSNIGVYSFVALLIPWLSADSVSHPAITHSEIYTFTAPHRIIFDLCSDVCQHPISMSSTAQLETTFKLCKKEKSVKVNKKSADFS